MQRGKYYRKLRFHIGQRIIKTTVAVYICLFIYQLRGQSEVPFFSAIAAVLCMQTNPQNSGKNAFERMYGTLIGAVYGVLLLYFTRLAFVDTEILFFITALCLIFVIQTSIYLSNGTTAAISCVVYLSIAASYNSDVAILIVTRERILDTIIGIVVALLINTIKIPRILRKNILFVFDIDHAEGVKGVWMTEYSKRELTRMIGSGANVTVSTKCSPAEIWERLSDLQLKLPVIAMNGSIFYEINECQYVRNYSISKVNSQRIIDILEERKLGYFVHAVVHDVLLIYVSDFRHMYLQDKYRRLRGTPYRNYIYGRLPEEQKALFFYILDENERVDLFLEEIEQSDLLAAIYFEVNTEKDYPGYKSVSFYSSNASIESRIQYLMEETGCTQVVTIGSDGDGYDVVIADGDENLSVKVMKRLYEGFFWEKREL